MKSNKIPVILDTDIGLEIDDTWALGFLLKCPELDVKLITTSSGNTSLKAKLVAKFLESVGRIDIPIGIGQQENLKKGWFYPWIKEYEISQYPGTVHINGIEVLCSTILNSSVPLTLIVTGPLGNVARALKVSPRITENSRFVGMHGSIRDGYWGSNTPHREYNVKKNIEASREVFQSSWEKTIAPLDTSRDIVLSGELLERFMKCGNLVVNSIKEEYNIWKKKLIPKLFMIKKNQTSVLFDTVPIYLGFSEELINIEELKIKISDRGFTQINENGNLIRCATSWKDVQAFKTLLVDRLTN
ncbi:MAG: nucleoside hydrolase [Candidatus Lokiarchaeota archaeon]|nr:nucleoside hydrolase [Candidatus Lokiarchaeota archaeon]